MHAVSDPGSSAMSLTSAVAAPPGVRATVVLVHGAFVDGSGWAGVHRGLVEDGYPVVIVQIPTSSLCVRAVPGSHAVFIANRRLSSR